MNKCTCDKCHCYCKRIKNFGKKHPTGNERLIHFYESVQLDDELRTAWRCGKLETVFIGSDNQIPPAYAAALMLERKYWASSEELRLDKVINALKNRAKLSASDKEYLNNIKKEFSACYIQNTDHKSQKHDQPEQNSPNRIMKTYRNPEILAQDLLYGRLLHGDYDKWISTRHNNLTTIFSVIRSIQHIDTWIHDVYKILIKAIDNKSFKPDESRIKLDTPAKQRVILP